MKTLVAPDTLNGATLAETAFTYSGDYIVAHHADNVRAVLFSLSIFDSHTPWLAKLDQVKV